MQRKDWVPPELPEQRSASDRILQYSRQDYVIGESSPCMLQRIAHRFNNGPSLAHTLPELDTSILMAQASGQASAAAHVSGLYELGGDELAGGLYELSDSGMVELE